MAAAAAGDGEDGDCCTQSAMAESESNADCWS